MAMRRRYSRFLPEDNQVLITNDAGLRLEANVVDESFGGIGVVSEPDPRLEEGLEVGVRFEDFDYEAVIVSLRPDHEDPNMVHLGLKWLEIESDEPDFDEEAEED